MNIHNQIPTDQPQDAPNKALDGFFQKAIAIKQERETLVSVGVPALHRLAKIASRDTGQASTVRRFLLGLYNGYRWPFDLTRLRGLDQDLFSDCLDVLTMDARATVQEIHYYFESGDAVFAEFAQMEAGQ
ncbi:hypothetical protein [Methylicorpusculum sp.]|uniref:DUF7673 family protein n=1 Tax=Methylicorpusculum sp. TaxID=2713644 RepID=UPI002AB8943B|nr:hypothetical protein [Methylicorpusculum sp.]MDZ4153745.1 hypothetical protein [Methylicorpusculum sp.]